MRKTIAVAALAITMLGTVGASNAATQSGTQAARALPAGSSIGVPHIVEGEAATIPVSPDGGTHPGRATSVAECPKGEVLTGGGANVTAGNSHAERYQLPASKPIDGNRWWAFGINTDTANTGTVTAYAICAKVIKVHELP